MWSNVKYIISINGRVTLYIEFAYFLEIYPSDHGPNLKKNVHVQAPLDGKWLQQRQP